MKKENAMKDFSRIISMILICAMTVCAAASCADNENEKPNVVDPNKQTEQQDDTPVFEEADFGGDTFTIVAYDDTATDFIDNYIDNETQTGEPINDAVIDRNTLVEEKYNVDVVKRAVSSPSSHARSASKSGTVDFEVVYEWGIRQVGLATEGTFYDFLQLPVIDLSQEYWAPSTQDDLTIADKMLIATSDITMNRIAWGYFIFFNANMCNDLKLELPYAYVDRNEWTFDNFLTMAKAASQDTNGDTIWDTEDRYGFLDDYGNPGGGLNYLVASAGITGCLKNADGTYTIDLLNEKIQQIYSKYTKTLGVDPAFTDPDMGSWLASRDSSMFASGFKAHRFFAFGEGHYLFAKFSMDMTAELTEMQEDYGVVPSPKYDSAQPEYYHYIDSCAPMLTVMKQTPDLDKVGTILEYMSYESMKNVLPAFYEQTIKTKRMPDIEGRDEKMLDIVRDSVHYSWTNLYYPAMKDAKGDPWDPCMTVLHDMLSSGNFASVYKSKQALIEQSINGLYDMILEIDVNK